MMTFSKFNKIALGLAIVNLVIALSVWNVSAICGWLVAACAYGNLLYNTKE